MSKFLVLALVAGLVCCAAAATNPPPAEFDDEPSQLAIFEDDATETGSLSEERKVFEDFCKQTRDEVKAHVNNIVNQGASFLFKSAGEQILDSAAKIGAQEKEAVQKGAQLIGQDARNAGQATNSVFSAIVDGVKSGAYGAIEQFKGYFSKDNMREKVYTGCDDVLDNLLPKLESKLEETKNELGSAAKDSLKAVIRATSLDNVGCITTGRISKISKSCLKLKQINPEILKSIGL